MRMSLIWAGIVCAASVNVTTVKASERVSVAMVGDVLLHQPQHQQALRSENGHISLWEDILPVIQSADIAYANLEGPIAPGTAGLGRTVNDPGRVFDKHVYTSYPMFNYHDFLADDLKRSGFDVVSTANNHALDRGSRGADLTVEHLARVGLGFSGTRSTRYPQASFAARLKINGWTVSFVACAEHTNGIADTKNQVLSCNQDALQVVAFEASDPTVDVVIATPHWGDEYQPLPNARQKQFAQALANVGATAIVGAHPHVPQPSGEITSSDGRVVPVVYSLGNFVSNQFHRQATQNEYLAWLEFYKTPQGVRSSLTLKKMKMTKGGAYKVVFSEW